MNKIIEGKMTAYMSDKLRVLSFLSIILVIYIHMFYTEGTDMPGLNIVESFWGQGICLLAVPLFFVISGYLFFLRCPNGVNSIWPKIRKRGKTLLMPYLLMNTVALLFYIVLNLIIDRVSALSNVVNFRILQSMQEIGVGKALLGFYWTDPVAFQLWFVRDLMVVVLFSPAIYYLLKYSLRNFAGMMGFLLVEALLVWGNCFSGYFGAAFWFIAGGYLAMHPKINPAKFETRRETAFLSVLLTIGFAVWNVISPQQIFGWLIPAAGIIALWTLFDVLFKKKENIFTARPILAFLCAYPFFVYLVHEPLLNILKKLPLLVSRSEYMLIAAYIMVPILFYVLAALLGKYLKRVFPKSYSVFTGNR